MNIQITRAPIKATVITEMLCLRELEKFLKGLEAHPNILPGNTACLHALSP